MASNARSTIHASTCSPPKFLAAIFIDRNGVLLATSSWAEIEKRRDDYQKLGVSIDSLARLDSRLYPFGPDTAHLLGDVRTGEKFHATNASLIEHDSNARLQGYADYSDLAPVVRVRHQRGNPLLQALLNRDRDVHSTIDIRLQLKASEILRERLQPSGKKGALVVMNAQTGDVLALSQLSRTSRQWPRHSTTNCSTALVMANILPVPPSS